MDRRLAPLAALALIAATGCHAGPTGNIAKPTPPPITRTDTSVAKIIDRLNRNASAISSLKATPRIEVSADGTPYSVKGLMAMERERDFVLRLKTTSIGKNVANIGSNDEEFWFWVAENRDPKLYFCNYKDLRKTQLAPHFQPDWILEAMGLREFDEREAKTISSTSPKPGQLLLTQIRKEEGGDMVTKETLVDEQSGEILEHRLYAGAKKELLARATILSIANFAVAGTSEGRVRLPDHFILTWVPEKFQLDVRLPNNETTLINPKFAESDKLALFTEPTIRGVDRVDLAQLAPKGGAGAARVHETIPAPRTGVKLGAPEAVPAGIEGASRTRRRPLPAISSDVESVAVVGAPIPTGTDPDAVQAGYAARRRGTTVGE
jgi:hypothetical protein